MIVCQHNYDSFDEELIGYEDKLGDFYGKSNKYYECSECGKRTLVSEDVGKNNEEGGELGEPTCYIAWGLKYVEVTPIDED